MDHPVSKGKILRVKHGYNPNSSSMGSLIFALPGSLLALTWGFALVSSLILSRLLKDSTRPSPKDPLEDLPEEQGEK